MTRPVSMDADDAVELGQLLEFLIDWLRQNDECLADSFRRFVGTDGYDIHELRSDLASFTVLLGTGSGDLVVEDAPPSTLSSASAPRRPQKA